MTLGTDADPAAALSIPPSRRWTGYGVNHLDCLNRPAMYARIRRWLAP
jgi:hypothetical protein